MGNSLPEIKTQNKIFKDYIFDKDRMKVYSRKRRKLKEIKTRDDYVSPTWKLYLNGVAYFVSLGEIMEYTLLIKPATFSTHH